MVLYEFYCPECNKEVVIRQSIHDDLPTLFCEGCKDMQLKQRLPRLRPLTCTSGSSINERCKQLARQDVNKLNKSDEKAWSDLVG